MIFRKTPIPSRRGSQPVQVDEAPADPVNSVEASGLTKRYGDTVALDDVSFEVRAGEVFGIVGANGAGKTTLVECVAGLRRPDLGHLRVLGLDPRRDAQTLRRHVGIHLQQSSLQDSLRVWEALDLYASFYKSPADWNSLIERWGLADKRRTAVSKLSGGFRQRLFIALALVGNPRLAILDELTTGLDSRARRSTWRLVKEMRDDGVTVLLVSHYPDEIESLCDRVMVLRHGRIVALDAPASLVEASGRRTLEDAIIDLEGGGDDQ